MTLVVHLITDRGAGDPACAELERRVAAAFPRAAVRVTYVAPHDTLEAGRHVAEAASAGAGAGDNVVVAHDVSVGPGQPGPWPAGAGEQLLVGRAVSGSLIVGSNVGWTWSSVIAELRGLYLLDVPVVERQGWPARLGTAIVHARRGHPHAIAGSVPRAQAPPLPQRVAMRLPGTRIEATRS
jgi:hypothetical protein